MIKIKIEQVTTTQYKAWENFVKHSEPHRNIQGEIQYEASDYGQKQKAVMSTDFETKEVVKERTVEVTLLEQEITTDSDFDLKAVIAAINNMSGRK